MSRHHTLPPIMPMVTPRPRKTERKSRLRGTAAAKGVRETDDIDASEGTSQALPAAHVTPVAIDAVEERAPRTPGKLSASTLAAVLAEQEKSNR